MEDRKDPHRVGQKVTRLSNVYNPKSRLMHGEIIHKIREKERYPNASPGVNSMLYDVAWDHGQIGTSYFWWGIDPE